MLLADYQWRRSEGLDYEHLKISSQERTLVRMSHPRWLTRWLCFLRSPIGHQWERIVEGQHTYQRCTGCGKTRGRWSPDSRDSTPMFPGTGD